MSSLITKTAKWTPIGPRILLEIEAVKTESAGGIIIPEKVARREQDTIYAGVLTATGETAFEDMMPSGNYPNIGTTLYFVKFSGNELEIEDKYYRVLNDEDAYLKKEEIKQ